MKKLTNGIISAIKRPIHLLFLGRDAVEKTEQVLAYILKSHPESSITSLMKLSYLIDYVSMRRFGEMVTNFNYKRYKYGPFDANIYGIVESLKDRGLVTDDSQWTPRGEEFIVYNINEDADMKLDKLVGRDIEIINEVIDSMRGYGAKALTEVAYKTPPMVELGAEIGNNNGLNEKLNLTAGSKE